MPCVEDALPSKLLRGLGQERTIKRSMTGLCFRLLTSSAPVRKVRQTRSELACVPGDKTGIFDPEKKATCCSWPVGKVAIHWVCSLPQRVFLLRKRFAAGTFR